MLALAACCSTACVLFTDLSGYAGPATTASDAASPDARLDPDAGKADAEAGDAAPDDPYSRAILQDAPLAYFKLEEASAGACKDEMGGVSSITCVYPGSGATPRTDGIDATSRGVHLDARSAVISLFATSKLSGKQPFTIEFWMQLDGPPSEAQVFSNEEGVGGTRTGQLAFFDVDGKLRTETWTSGALLFYTLSASPAPSGKFAHIAYGYSDVESRDFLYVDANRAEGMRLNAGDHVAPSTAFTLGGWVGKLDELAIYGTALSPTRIAAHYAAR